MTYQEKHQNPFWESIILFILLALFAAAVAIGCNSEKKVFKRIEKLNGRNELAVTKWAANKFPIKEKYIIGKTDTLKGDTITVDCDSVYSAAFSEGLSAAPSINPVLPNFLTSKPNTTVANPSLRFVRVPCPPSFFRVDTLVKADSAALKLAYLELKKANKKIDKLEKLNNACMWFAIVAAAFIALIFIAKKNS